MLNTGKAADAVLLAQMLGQPLSKEQREWVAEAAQLSVPAGMDTMDWLRQRFRAAGRGFPSVPEWLAVATDEARREILEDYERGLGPAAEVVEFPPKLVETERFRQEQVAEQDRLRRAAYQALCDATWQRNLDQWAAEARRQGQFAHRGPGDPDYPGKAG
jgi:hypothetical protein